MTEPPVEPVESPDAAWPVSAERTVVEQTAAGPPIDRLPPDRGIGAGFLLGFAILALAAAGVAVAYLLTHRGGSKQSTTVVVTSRAVQSAPAVPTTPQVAVPKKRATTTAPSTTAAVTTSAAPVTTAPGTTAPVPPAPVTPTSATVPDVGGATEQAAVTAFNKAGVLASLVFVPSQDPLGTVEGQAKSAGTTVPYHAHVQLNLSRGPGAKSMVSVPDVTGKSLADAVAALNGAQLRLIYVRFPLSSKAQAGTIVQQSPLGGGQAPANGQVLVFLGVSAQ